MNLPGLFLALCISFTATADPFGEELTETEFSRLHAQLQASSEAPWRTIPWEISLLDAQRASVSQKKPIFIWAMDGHPLGCT
jgi:hypothetical protein